MRTEGETKTTNPINIIQAKVERSLLCIAIGQVTLNLTLTVHRHEVHSLKLRKRLIAAAVALAAMVGVSIPWQASADGVFASNVPVDLVKQLKSFAPLKVTADDNVLRVVLPRQIVRNTDLFSSMYLAYCSPTWGNKGAWSGRDLKRIEVVNQINAQGFAFAASKADCIKSGNMSDAQAKKNFIQERTWVCVAGNPCRPRRVGELTAADE